MDAQTARTYYLKLAVEYHIAARYSAFAGFSYACGILFHHAIEMYLKAELRLGLSDKELKSLRHDLKKTWKMFKQATSQSGPNTFDKVIKSLDKHESLRYPENVFAQGTTTATMVIDFTRSAVTPSNPTTTAAGNEFRLYVDELDALAKFILEHSHVNPVFLTEGMNDRAQEFLKLENKSQIWN
jgi:HEPN domain-containing protein